MQKRIINRYGILIIMIILSMFTIVSCGKENTASKQVKNEKREAPKELPIATIVIKDYGTIEAELYPHIAPNTVNNFIELSNKGFYNNLTFHRIIKDFMIQGGDPNGNGQGGPGYSIEGEFTENGFQNDLKHEKGVLSMARTNEPNTAGSQFFIMTKTNKGLDGKYAAFGKVTKGLDILDKIQVVKTDSNDKPETPVVIESIKVDTKGIKYEAPKKN
ncbi:peptidyl-prolyl cis-trans isomerase B (cyclophilin B) [Clostridium cavendishii DSM 21758]|uniref:Peptidyl-prolyl cis-trans isomerase n=1 Tax=Clostridium cavendishii DSM 21758 TaxID=1121302 RepID=A0A1M6CTI2_9CLOT|nr:peptidylprolyl isomerase [Clostridium cavendishii]SHI64259.1 peptidyl-prolyl cis-trans isomerase B (cyclophilin B) [Clostridium cavendishii DSM 21758]